MPKGISLLNSDKENIIKAEVEKAKSIDEAVLIALEVHKCPLTFNDLRKLMPEKFQHQEKVSRAIKRLIKRGKIQEVLVIVIGEAAKAYALMSDTPILVGIPVGLMREVGYEVSIGFGYERWKEPYDLYEVKADYIFIHINPSKSSNNPR